MKKNFFIMATMSLAIISCQQEELAINSIEEPELNQIQLVEIVNGTEIIPANDVTTRNVSSQNLALQFNSEATYQSFLKELKAMTHKDRINTIKAYGLTSLQELANIADKELEEIWNANDNETDFKKAYEKYKQKYNGVLVSNTYDPTDCTLYVPSGDNPATYVVNKEHAIVIGNKIEKISISNDMGQTEKLLFSERSNARDASNTYSFKKEVNKKKTVVSVTLNANSGVQFHVGYQKKKALWWKRDNDRETYLKFNASYSNFYYTYQGSYGQLIRGSQVDLFTWANQGVVDYWIGGLQPGKTSLSATLYLWTDETRENEKATYKNYVRNGVIENNVEDVKCDVNKAYGGSFTLYMPIN